MIIFRRNRFFATIFGLKPKPQRHLGWRVGAVTPKIKKGSMLELTITNEQKVTIALNPVTAAGRPAKVDGVPQWTVASGDSQVVPAADGLSAVLVSSDNPGETDINVSADADLGEGVETISDVIKLHVEGARAAALGLTSGTPETK